MEILRFLLFSAFTANENLPLNLSRVKNFDQPDIVGLLEKLSRPYWRVVLLKS